MFCPPRWLQNPHLQTILGALLREGRTEPSKAVYVPSAHHDLLRLDVSPESDEEPRVPTVLLLHGIAGSSRASHVVTTWRAIRRRLGWRVAALNFRGSDQRFPIPRLYHAGSSEDVEEVVQYILSRWEGPLFVVGFSLGANVLLKWLGERGEDFNPRLQGACALSVPFELGACADQLETTWLHRYYRQRMVSELKERTARLLRLFPGCLHIDAEILAKIVTLRDFDGAVTAPLHGFPDLESYYSGCSSARFLERIRANTLILHAQDDPFYPLQDPGKLVRSKQVKLEVPSHGGHLGFLGPGCQFWFEERLLDFLGSSSSRCP